MRVDTVTSAPLKFVGAEGIGGFISGAIERFEFFELVILNVHVLPDPTPPTVALAFVHVRAPAGARQRPLDEHVRRVPRRLRRVDGRWRYAGRRYQSLARTGRSEVFPFPASRRFD